jgi:hypothetical protein
VEVQHGDLYQACELAGRALAGYLHVGSVSGVQHVRQFRVHLNESGVQRRAPRAVARLDERLADVHGPIAVRRQVLP